jgi:hypothetical protein
MVMRFHYGLGVGHIYSHQDVPDIPSNTFIGHQEVSLNSDGLDGLEKDVSDDDDDSEYDCIGVEEEALFDQEKNGSTMSIVKELDNMFLEHEFDYEP